MNNETFRNRIANVLDSIEKLAYVDEDTSKIRIRSVINLFEVGLGFPVYVGKAAIPEEVTEYIVVSPNGSQQFPDMSVVRNGKSFDVEVKSSKSGRIMWNNNYPRANALYIFTGREGKRGETGTTYSLGKRMTSTHTVSALKAAMNMKAQMMEALNGRFPKQTNQKIQHIRFNVGEKLKLLSDPKRFDRQEHAKNNFMK
jgi:hypothetical protein